MSLLEGLAELAEQHGFGVYRTMGVYDPGETGIVLSQIPSEPDRTLVLTRYGGAESDTALPYDQPRVQARVRHVDTTRSLQAAQALYDRWHGLGPLTLPNGLRLQLMVGSQSGPMYLQVDDNDRVEHTLNFRVEYRNTRV